MSPYQDRQICRSTCGVFFVDCSSSKVGIIILVHLIATFLGMAAERKQAYLRCIQKGSLRMIPGQKLRDVGEYTTSNILPPLYVA